MSVSRVEDDLLQRVDTVQTKLIRGPKSDRLEAPFLSQHAMAKCSWDAGEMLVSFGQALPTSAFQARRAQVPRQVAHEILGFSWGKWQGIDVRNDMTKTS